MIFYLGNKAQGKVPENIRVSNNRVKNWKYGYNQEHDVIIISKDGTLGTIFKINGIYIGLPEPPADKKEILGWDKTTLSRRWVRKELPEGFSESTQHLQKNKDFIREELRLRREGKWIYLKDELVYMTGLSYYLYQWNRLDDGYPNFRVIQNELMIFWEACKADYRSYGIAYVKNRRFGWSTICNTEQLYTATQHRNKKLGIVSKTNDDAKEMFTMAYDVFKRLPFFLQPPYDDKTQSRIVLKGSTKQGNTDTEEGIDSYIRYYSTALNSMDGGKKVFRSSLDECFGKGTKILMSDLSFKNIEDIEVNEYVIVEGGKEVRVANKIQGIDELFKVSQPYSEDYVVSSKHRLYLEQRCKVNGIHDDGVKIMTPVDYLNLGKYRTRTTHGVRSLGLEFEEKELIIDPYILGLWLGDGHKDGAIILVNIQDDAEVGIAITEYCDENDYSLTIRNTSSDICKKYGIRRPEREQHLNGNSVSNKFVDNLKNLKLHYNKHIPIKYLQNSTKNRLELLAGIIDSDGHLVNRNNSYHYEIGLAKKDLFDDIVFLVRTLGFKVSAGYKKTNFNTDSWKMSIYGDLSKIPCKIERKKVPVSYKRQYADHINKIDINPIGKGEYFGIQLDADNDDDRRLILNDFTISMNCGKFPKEVPFDRYWGIVKTSHRQGVRIVGKAMVGSTVNALKKGGAEFQTIFNQSDTEEPRNKNDQTTSGLYGLFIPARYGLEGKYDTYGFSIVDDLKEKILTDEGIYTKMGSVSYLKNEAEAFKEKNDLEGEHEFKRQFAETLKDAFRDESGECSFNLIKIEQQIDYNTDESNHDKNGSDEIERGNFTWKDGIQDTEVIWNPNPLGRFWLASGCHPPLEFRNQKEMITKNGVTAWSPMAEHIGCAGIDPYDRSQSADGRGSKGAIHIQTKFNTSDLPNNAYILEYLDRAATVELFFEDCLMCLIYFSMPMLAELSNVSFLKMVKERGYRHYSLNNPFKSYKDLSPTEKDLGAAPAQDAKIGLQQFYAIESYIENYVGIATNDNERPKGSMGFMPFNRTLTQWKDIDLRTPGGRTKFDSYISSSLAALGNQRRVLTVKKDEKPRRNPFTQYNNEGQISVAL